jgi:transmembrane sensor
MLEYDQARLSEIAADFNRYNSKQMIVTDEDAANIRIGGMFPASDPEAFSRLLHDAYGLRVDENATTIKISN